MNQVELYDGYQELKKYSEYVLLENQYTYKECDAKYYKTNENIMLVFIGDVFKHIAVDKENSGKPIKLKPTDSNNYTTYVIKNEIKSVKVVSKAYHKRLRYFAKDVKEANMYTVQFSIPSPQSDVDGLVVEMGLNAKDYLKALMDNGLNGDILEGVFKIHTSIHKKKKFYHLSYEGQKCTEGEF